MKPEIITQQTQLRFDFDNEDSLNALLSSLRDNPPAMLAGYQVLDMKRQPKTSEKECTADILKYLIEDNAELSFLPDNKKLDVVIQANGLSGFGANQAIHDLTAGVMVLLRNRSSFAELQADNRTQ